MMIREEYEDCEKNKGLGFWRKNEGMKMTTQKVELMTVKIGDLASDQLFQSLWTKESM